MIDSIAIYGVIALGLALAVVFLAGLSKYRPQPLRQDFFKARWDEIQALMNDKTTWPLAVINADKLLDDALRKRKFRGKTMGERLVSAQRWIKNNDAVWFGHKLRNRLVHEADTTHLRENDVKQAVEGLKKALKDLGALPK